MGGGVQFHLVHLGVVLVVHLGGGWGRPVSPCTFGGSTTTSSPFGGWVAASSFALYFWG